MFVCFLLFFFVVFLFVVVVAFVCLFLFFVVVVFCLFVFFVCLFCFFLSSLGKREHVYMPLVHLFVYLACVTFCYRFLLVSGDSCGL